MTDSIRKALILAAGFGSRLQPAQSVPKPLTMLANEPSIVRLIRQFCASGIHDVGIVVGYRKDEIISTVTGQVTGEVRITWFDNPRYEEPNGLSVLAAGGFVDERVLLSMSDHLFLGDCIPSMAALDRGAPETVLLVDRNIEGVFDLDDATKVLVDDSGAILAIGKQISRYNAIDTGLFCISPALMEALSGLESPSLSEGVKLLADRGLMRTQDITAGVWQDIDTPETLEYARSLLETE